MADEERGEELAHIRSSEEDDSDAPESTALPPEAAEILKDVPPRTKKEFEAFFASHYGPRENPIARKITSEHVGKMLDLQKRDMELNAADRNNGRWFLMGVAVLVAALIVLLALADKDEVLGEVIRLGIAFAGGFGGGYGVALVRRRG